MHCTHKLTVLVLIYGYMSKPETFRSCLCGSELRQYKYKQTFLSYLCGRRLQMYFKFFLKQI